MSKNKSYRLKYDSNNQIDHLTLKFEQSFDFLEVLSLKIRQEDVYKLYTSDYGVLVGRVLANDGFGIPNVKVSIFIQNNNTIDGTNEKDIVYPYKTINTKDQKGIKFNLLPSNKVNKCHQNVGTFPSKSLLLDNNILIETFDEYYKFTTTTNASGDYMFFGVPVGSQELHIDVDLSDIGVLSQAPRDLGFKGTNLKQVDSPNKFKKSTNLESLPQIISQNTSVYIYPFWGDNNEGEIAISKKNINLNFKFEPTCVFMGGAFSDSEKSKVKKNCKASTSTGKMSELTTGQGSIEMIRKEIDGTIKQFEVSGNRLIDGNGVWCYQIPMNLDYTITDEYGNIVPTDDPTKGIPTRAEVRFRISMDDNGGTFTQSKTASYLIPNNSVKADYEFGENTKDSSFVNLLWNKVYSVKNYIPRIQKNKLPKTRRFIGLKSVNNYNNNSPIPYNNIFIDMNLRFSLLCMMSTLIINIVGSINSIISWLADNSLGVIKLPYIVLPTAFGGDNCTYLEGFDYFVPSKYDNNGGYINSECKARTDAVFKNTTYENVTEPKWTGTNIIECIESSLSTDNEVIQFDFFNDWLNGSLYFPRYAEKVKLNKKNGQIKSKYCGVKSEYSTYLVQTCAPSINKDLDEGNNSSNEICYNKEPLNECYLRNASKYSGSGILNNYTGNLYYKSISENGVVYYASDIILLGSLSDCDIDGIPMLHQLLPSTSFKLPSEIGEFDDENQINVTNQFVEELDVQDYSYGGTDYEELTGVEPYQPQENTEFIILSQTAPPANSLDKIDASGVDWGNDPEQRSSGLFVGIGCLNSNTTIKTCINASRLCEIGVDFDETHEDYIDENDSTNEIASDGFISLDEVSDGDARSMFATLNYNNLKVNENKKYEFIYNFPDGFDGKLRYDKYPENDPNTALSTDTINEDYYKFRFGVSSLNDLVYYSDDNNKFGFPKYKNSFYFYFGLKYGSSALDVFNSQYFVPCSNPDEDKFQITFRLIRGESACKTSDGSFGITIENQTNPCTVYVDGLPLNDYYNTNVVDEIILTNKQSKFYTVTVIDANNYKVVKTYFLPLKGNISFDYDTTNASSAISNDGSINITNILNTNSNIQTVYYNIYSIDENNTETLLYSGDSTTGSILINTLGNGKYSIEIYESPSCKLNVVKEYFQINSPAYIETKTPIARSLHSANGGGTGLITGGGTVSEKGICWNQTGVPTITDNKAIIGGVETDYTVVMTNLFIGQKYYVKAYVITEFGLSYGNEIEYTHQYVLQNNYIMRYFTSESVKTLGADYPVGTNLEIVYSYLNIIGDESSRVDPKTKIINEGNRYSGSIASDFNKDGFTIEDILPASDEFYNYFGSDNIMTDEGEVEFDSQNLF